MIEVTGLSQLRKALKAVDKEAPKAISRAHKDVAGIVVRVAQSKMSGTRLASRVKARGSQTQAKIAFLGHPKKRGQKSPKTDAFVQEFGGKVPLFGDESRKFTVKPRKRGGYFIYPAIKDSSARINGAYLRKLDISLRRHFDQ